MLTKNTLRKTFSDFRSSLSADYRQSADAAVFGKITNSLHFNNASTLCIYISHQFEIDTKRIIEYALEQHKHVVVPRVNGDSLDLYEIHSLTECIPGFKQILEPPLSNRLIAPPLVSLFIVLGLAFDTYKYRVGYGKGYTDRLLEKQKGFKIGIAYTDQLVYEVPHEPHDVALNQIITDTISIT